MRGFPLLNTILVCGLFALAWWPLRQAATEKAGVGSASPAQEMEPSPDSGEAAPAQLRFFASSPLRRLRVEHLGQPLLDETILPAESTELNRRIESLPIPKEGIEFWVEAEFALPASDGRAALGLEIATENRDPLTRTLWSEGETIADSVVFVWDE